MNSSAVKLIEIRDSDFGKGLFALKDIPPYTIICKVTGTQLSFEETLLLGAKESHTLQTGINQYLLCDPPFLYSNHSCQPNCAVNSNLEFYTIEPIKVNEELLWDYSTSMLERHWTMHCFCKSKQCRNVIEDFDLLPEDLQRKYLKMNIVFPFIVEYLENKIVTSVL